MRSQFRDHHPVAIFAQHGLQYHAIYLHLDVPRIPAKVFSGAMKGGANVVREQRHRHLSQMRSFDLECATTELRTGGFHVRSTPHTVEQGLHRERRPAIFKRPKGHEIGVNE